MAVVDSILVNAKLSGSSKYSDVESTPIYIVRDHVQYYHKYIDDKGNVSEDLTTVIFTLPPIAILPPGSLGTSITIVLSLSDFNTLMTT